MRIAIIGASGFVGSNLTQQLLSYSSHSLVLFSHRASLLQFTKQQEKHLRHVDGSVLDKSDITAALHNCDIAVYLVHMMGESGRRGKFVSSEAVAARNFADAVVDQNIKRVIYVGGMASNESATKHLRSRKQTGDIIRTTVPQLIELRTPMVVGNGGAGYEVLRALVLRFPVFPLPRWAKAITQPITVDDVSRYVIASLTIKPTEHITIDIAGPEKLSYADLAKRIAARRAKRLLVMPIPFAPKIVARTIIKLLVPKRYASTVNDMLASAGHSTPPPNGLAVKYFPDIIPESVDAAL